jgi:hypothetical protein
MLRVVSPESYILLFLLLASNLFLAGPSEIQFRQVSLYKIFLNTEAGPSEIQFRQVSLYKIFLNTEAGLSEIQFRQVLHPGFGLDRFHYNKRTVNLIQPVEITIGQN